jgi:hypothetical protein
MERGAAGSDFISATGDGSMTADPPTNRPHAGLYAAIIAGIVVLAGMAAWSFNAGGLPGTRNTPSTAGDGQRTVGRTAAD